jgi:ureidoglycolate lyase
MSAIEHSCFTVIPEPLSPVAFEPFGDVAERPVDVRRRYLPTAANRADDAVFPTLWISNSARVGTLPLQLTTLERHPFSAQTFIPLGIAHYLAIVCKPAAGGGPDLATLRCFIAGAHQSVTFARNVWHHPMTVLQTAMEFIVAIGITGRDDDDVFVDLDAKVHVTLPPTA